MIKRVASGHILLPVILLQGKQAGLEPGVEMHEAVAAPADV